MRKQLDKYRLYNILKDNFFKKFSVMEKFLKKV